MREHQRRNIAVLSTARRLASQWPGIARFPTSAGRSRIEEHPHSDPGSGVHVRWHDASGAWQLHAVVHQALPQTPSRLNERCDKESRGKRAIPLWAEPASSANREISFGRPVQDQLLELPHVTCWLPPDDKRFGAQRPTPMQGLHVGTNKQDDHHASDFQDHR